MSKAIVKPLVVLLGSAFVGSATIAHAAAGEMTFRLETLGSGYALAAAPAKAEEGKCGEGKCGLGMMDTNKDGKVSLDESKSGKFSERQFRAWDKNRDGFLDKSELDAMHAVKGKEGYCS
jgi:uncharacterized low-complexity protein